MRIDFQGLRAMGLNSIRTRRDLYQAKACISAYHDIILSLLKGETDIAEIKDFFFHGKTDAEIKNASYMGDVITFKKKDPA